MQLRVLDRAGREVSARFVGVTPASRLTELSLVSLLPSHYDLSGVARVGGGRTCRPRWSRRASTDAATDSAVAARWWVDDSTGLLLWQETYDDDGRLQSAVGFRDVTFGEAPFLSHLPQAAVPRTTTSLTLAKTTDLAAQGWSPPDDVGRSPAGAAAQRPGGQSAGAPPGVQRRAVGRLGVRAARRSGRRTAGKRLGRRRGRLRPLGQCQYGELAVGGDRVDGGQQRLTGAARRGGAEFAPCRGPAPNYHGGASWRGGTGFSVSASSSRGRQHEPDDTWQTRTAPAARRIDPMTTRATPATTGRSRRPSFYDEPTPPGPPSGIPHHRRVHRCSRCPVRPPVQHQPPRAGPPLTGGAGLLIAAVLLALVVGGAAGFGGARLAAWTATPAPGLLDVGSDRSGTDRSGTDRSGTHRSGTDRTQRPGAEPGSDLRPVDPAPSTTAPAPGSEPAAADRHRHRGTQRAPGHGHDPGPGAGPAEPPVPASSSTPPVGS